MAAKIIARNPNILEVLKILSEDPAKAAIIAPTMITDEIAFVYRHKWGMKRWSNTPHYIIADKN